MKFPDVQLKQQEPRALAKPERRVANQEAEGTTRYHSVVPIKQSPRLLAGWGNLPENHKLIIFYKTPESPIYLDK